MADNRCAPAQRRFDVSSSTCVEALQQLFNAYMLVVTGKQSVVVRQNDRWLEYNRADADQLRNLYQTLYNQCPGAAAAGLPNLSPGLRVQRGAPARGLQVWPRL